MFRGMAARKNKPHKNSLKDLIAFCQSKKSFRYKLIASYLEAYDALAEDMYVRTMKRAEMMADEKWGK